MQVQVSAHQGCVLGVAYAIAGVFFVTIVITKLSNLKSPNLDAIPTVGPSTWLGSLWGGPKRAILVLQEGYEKYKSAPFKATDGTRWIVVLGGRQHIEELRKAPDNVLSFIDAADDIMQTKHTMGPELHYNTYHVEVIRSHLTQNLSGLYPEIRDEVFIAFDEVLDLRDSEWKSVNALSAIQKVVCRTSNRLFVGFPLCRDPDWIDFSIRHTLNVIAGADIMRIFPGFLAPLLAYFLIDVPGNKKHALKHLTPIIETRLKLQEEHGNDWADKPNDLLSWMLDEAPEGPERTVERLTTRIVATNFTAIHTSSNSFYQALFFLAENPQYIQPLRKEVESIVQYEGWSKASLGKMRKIDSFLKESQRLVGVGSPVSLMRKAMNDFSFSDGTFIPKGTLLVAPSLCLHLDNTHYNNAHVFDPFRFSNLRDEEGVGVKHQFASTSPEYLPFGHGKYACPGRFFASTELKTMLAHVVMSYDVKLDDKNSRKKDSLFPDPAAKIMLRRRAH